VALIRQGPRSFDIHNFKMSPFGYKVVLMPHQISRC
jgi:hypothetical protein